MGIFNFENLLVGLELSDKAAIVDAPRGWFGDEKMVAKSNMSE